MCLLLSLQLSPASSGGGECDDDVVMSLFDIHSNPALVGDFLHSLAPRRIGFYLPLVLGDVRVPDTVRGEA